MTSDKPLTYKTLVDLWKSLPPAPPRLRLAFRPTEFVPEGQVYRMDLRTLPIPMDVDVTFAIHPLTLTKVLAAFRADFPDYGEREVLEAHHQSGRTDGLLRPNRPYNTDTN